MARTEKKAVIFDFFGVFCPPVHGDWIRARGINTDEPFWKDLFERVDYGKIARSELLEIVSQKSGFSPEQIEEEVGAAVTIDPDLLALVGELKKNYKTALLSNAGHDFLESVLAEYELHPYFDNITVSCKINMIKPNPEIFLHSLREIGAAPQDAVFVDDTIKNVEAARRLGLGGALYIYRDSARLREELRAFGFNI